jgi:hypothetical protein
MYSYIDTCILEHCGETFHNEKTREYTHTRDTAGKQTAWFLYVQMTAYVCIFPAHMLFAYMYVCTRVLIWKALTGWYVFSRLCTYKWMYLCTCKGPWDPCSCACICMHACMMYVCICVCMYSCWCTQNEFTDGYPFWHCNINMNMFVPCNYRPWVDAHSYSYRAPASRLKHEIVAAHTTTHPRMIEFMHACMHAHKTMRPRMMQCMHKWQTCAHTHVIHVFLRNDIHHACQERHTWTHPYIHARSNKGV